VPHDRAFDILFLLALLALGMARVRFWRRQRDLLGIQFIRRESLLVELRQVGALVAFVLIGIHIFTPRLLWWSEFPVAVAVRVVAAILTVLLVPFVMGIARWVRERLDPPWRTRLKTTGPYGVVRHPLYASIMAVAVPLTVVASSWLVGTLAAALIVDLVRRARREDSALASAFGEEHTEYVQRVRAFLPRRLRPAPMPRVQHEQ
jgi:protein-S-isoprenylcysteine O-methyltransferase Ste14